MSGPETRSWLAQRPGYVAQSLRNSPAALVQQYLLAAGGWHGLELLDRSPDPRRSDPLFAVVGRAAKAAGAS